MPTGHPGTPTSPLAIPSNGQPGGSPDDGAAETEPDEPASDGTTSGEKMPGSNMPGSGSDGSDDRDNFDSIEDIDTTVDRVRAAHQFFFGPIPLCNSGDVASPLLSVESESPLKPPTTVAEGDDGPCPFATLKTSRPRIMLPYHRFRSLAGFLLGALFAACTTSQVDADTVYLTNGNWIHGIVQEEEDGKVRVDIGELGFLVIPSKQIHEIEKNDQTGSGYALSDAWSDRGATPPRDTVGKGRDENPDRGEDDASPESESSAEEVSASTEGDMPPWNRLGAPPDPQSLRPALRDEIGKHVYNLQRQQSRYRVRAERKLKSIGRQAVPFLLPLATHTHDLVRIAVFRILDAVGGPEAIETSIEALTDPNQYVRDYAARFLRRITGEHFGRVRLASPRQREQVRQRWRTWWEQQAEQYPEATAELDVSAPAPPAPGR